MNKTPGDYYALDMFRDRLKRVFGIFDEPLSMAGYKAMGERLSGIIGHSPAWGATYLCSLTHGSLVPSRRIIRAMANLEARYGGLDRKANARDQERGAIITRNLIPPKVYRVSEDGQRVRIRVTYCRKCGARFIPQWAATKYCPNCRTSRKKGSRENAHTF